MQIQKEDVKKAVIFRCEGQLDANTAAQLDGALQQEIGAGKKHIIVDFSKVDYLSSAGMRLLLSVTKKLDANGGKLFLISVQDNVMEIIKMAGFESILHLQKDEKEALNQI